MHNADCTEPDLNTIASRLRAKLLSGKEHSEESSMRSTSPPTKASSATTASISTARQTVMAQEQTRLKVHHSGPNRSAIRRCCRTLRSTSISRPNSASFSPKSRGASEHFDTDGMTFVVVRVEG